MRIPYSCCTWAVGSQGYHLRPVSASLTTPAIADLPRGPLTPKGPAKSSTQQVEKSPGFPPWKPSGISMVSAPHQHPPSKIQGAGGGSSRTGSLGLVWTLGLMPTRPMLNPFLPLCSVSESLVHNVFRTQPPGLLCWRTSGLAELSWVPSDYKVINDISGVVVRGPMVLSSPLDARIQHGRSHP